MLYYHDRKLTPCSEQSIAIWIRHTNKERFVLAGELLVSALALATGCRTDFGTLWHHYL